MDIFSVEKFIRTTVLTCAVVGVALAGMVCLRIVKMPKHPAKARSTPVPTESDLQTNYTVQQTDLGKDADNLRGSVVHSSTNATNSNPPGIE